MNRTYLRRAEWTTRQRIRHGAETAVVAARPELVQLLRENQRLLRELAAGYRMPRVLQRDARWASAEPPVITCPHDIVTLLGDEMSTLCTEQLRVVLLDAKNHVVGCDVLYQGTVHSISVRAAEVLRPAVVANAPSLIVVHNHPSGDPHPSAEDVRTTESLMAAGDLLDIAVLDHVVLGRDGRYVSVQERGLVSLQLRCHSHAA